MSSKPQLLPSNRLVCVAFALAGSVAASTAKPWFMLVISTAPSESRFTGWFAPRWPWCIFSVFAPTAKAEHLVPEADAEQRLFGFQPLP